MALVYIRPQEFPGGIAGGYPIGDSGARSQTGLGVPVGTTGTDTAGNEYTVVKAGAGIAINEAVAFNAGLSDVRKTSATQQLVLGVAAAAFSSGDFGWLLTKGSVVAKVVGGTAINSLLVTGATAGTLQLAAATDFAGARGAVQLTAEAAGLATVYLR